MNAPDVKPPASVDKTGTPQAKTWIGDLDPYVPGRTAVAGVKHPVKLSSNESVFGPSPKAVAAYQAAANALVRYPDGGSTDLREALAAFHGIEADRIVCGAGSDDILTLLIQAYVGPGDEVLHSRYGFMIYPIQAKAVGGTPVYVPNKDWAADVDGILAAVTARTKIVFIDNPNNPTGAYLPASEIERLHAGLPGHIVLVLDAAYAECVTADDYACGMNLARTKANVITTRTFSKQYALAGLRIGWGYGAPQIIDALNRIRLVFNVNVPAQHAALAALEDQDHLQASQAFNAEGRDYLTARLTAMGLDVVPSQTNFVLIGFPTEAPFRAADANDYLTKHGYLLRYLPGMGLVDHLRMTIGTAQDNAAVCMLLEAFLAGRDV